MKDIKIFLRKKFPDSTRVIITDHIVKKLYGEKLRALLQQGGHKVFLFSVPAGEQSKNQKYKTMIEEAMLEARIDRQSIIVALGGGVVGDLAGFIAATYMRGIPYIQVPTTLLSMVDSSIGGKTGIDTPQGKNLIGAFWQPQAIFVDLKFTEKLSQKQYIDGLLEAIKIFITSDAKNFAYAEKNIDSLLARDRKVLARVVKNAIRLKTNIVARDEKENGERMILNFGHTIGHALEKSSRYKMTHGHAVGLGVIVESRLSMEVGKLAPKDYSRIAELLIGKMGVEPNILQTYQTKEILEKTKNDKKRKDGQTRFVLLEKIGKVKVKKNTFAHPVSDTIVARVLAKVKLAKRK